jgi:Mrp family chromosome partitioning ATPase
MGKVIVVTSGKGGVGKTTSTAALGAALAKAPLAPNFLRIILLFGKRRAVCRRCLHQRTKTE